MKRQLLTILMILLFSPILHSSRTIAQDQLIQSTGTAFTYQGYLNRRTSNGNSPAEGSYDFEFRLFEALSGGTPIGIVSHTLAVTNGVFTAQLNFNQDVFNGDSRYLEVAIKLSGTSGNYTTLAPRQELTPTPYSLAIPGVITKNGNVGIGTKEPVAKLHVAGSSQIDGSANINGGVSIGGNTSVGGNVGIGTKEPVAKLHVAGSSQIDGNSTINGNVSIEGNTNVGGNVGIGTANPERRLHVAGNARIDGWLYLYGTDFWMGANDRGDGGRAMVHDGGDSLVLNYANDFPGGTYVDSNLDIRDNLTVHGDIKVRGEPLVRIKRFRNVGLYANVDTGIPASDYECVVASWSARLDVNEGNAGDYMAWPFVHQGNWYFSFKFWSEGDHENPDVDILCFRKEIALWEGFNGATRTTWEPD